MAQHWDRDPETGDYILQGGSPKQTDSLTVPAYHRLKTKRGLWMYAPDADYGSDYHTVTKRRTTSDAFAMENIGVAALQPLVDDGRAATIDVTTQVVARHGTGLQISIHDSKGEVEQLNLPRID